MSRNMSRQLLKISKDGDSTTFSLGNLYPVLSHPHNEKLFPDVQRVLSMCLCLFPFVLPLGTTVHNLAPLYLHPAFSHFPLLIRFSLFALSSFFTAEMPVSNHPCSHFTVLQHFHPSPVLRTHLDTSDAETLSVLYS